jgi:hypothetical protein
MFATSHKELTRKTFHIISTTEGASKERVAPVFEDLAAGAIICEASLEF